MLSEKRVGLILSQREARSTQAGTGFVSIAKAFFILNTAREGRLVAVSEVAVTGLSAHSRSRDVEFSSAIMKTISLALTGIGHRRKAGSKGSLLPFSFPLLIRFVRSLLKTRTGRASQ